MTSQEFFSIYLPFLEKALEEDYSRDGFTVYGPDWFVENQQLRNELDLFEENNFDNYRPLFEKVALYFDAKSHGFNKIEGVDISCVKNELKAIIKAYKHDFHIN